MGKPLKALDSRADVQARLDGLVNLLSGIGDKLKDKRLSAKWEPDIISQEELEILYRTSDMAAAIIEVPIDEEFRRGFDLRIGEEDALDETTAEQAEAMQNLLDERDFLTKIHEARCWARAYGGAGLLVGADDGKGAEQELDETSIQTFTYLTPLTPEELRPVAWDLDLKSARYGEPLFYEVRPLQMPASASTSSGKVPRLKVAQPMTEPVTVHYSRIIRFEGTRISRRQLRANDSIGWGDSVLLRCHELIRDFQAAWQAVAIILQSFSQPYMKLVGLADMLEEEDGAQRLMARLAGIQMARSVAKMVLLDEKEEFGQVTTALGGLGDILNQFAIRLAAAARIPVTLLMGQQPAGLNATGDNDVRNFYARVAAAQHKSLRPVLNQVLRLLFLSKDGPTSGTEPETWRVEFKPLWQPTDVEQADLRLKQAGTDEKYITQGVLSPEEVAISRFGGASYSTETVIDPKSRSDITPDDSDKEPELPAGAVPAGGGFPQKRAQANKADARPKGRKR